MSIQWEERTVFSTSDIGTTGYPYVKIWSQTPWLDHTRINSMRSQTNISANTTRLLEENLESESVGLSVGFGKAFLDTTPKT